MTDEIRLCPECGFQREFAQLHPAAGQCRDSADGQCPEWFCVRCGAGVLIRLHPAAVHASRVLARSAGRLDRVA